VWFIEGNSATVLHDDNGNMVEWGNRNYIWNVKGQLTEVRENSSTIATFKYDSLNRRIEKTINSVTTKYLYDGNDIIMEMTSSGTPTVFYVRTLNIDEPLARIELSTGDIRYYHADALGSIIALTDENGTVKTQYNYSPFGATEVIGEALDNPFQYTGRENDGDTGLYYYRARYYSPEMGRFISEDPIGLAGGINMYSYVGNSPLNWIDPLGLFENAVTPEEPDHSSYYANLKLWTGGILTSTGIVLAKVPHPYARIGAAAFVTVGSYLTFTGGKEVFDIEVKNAREFAGIINGKTQALEEESSKLDEDLCPPCSESDRLFGRCQ
jgi:RHS repeat-associated protein